MEGKRPIVQDVDQGKHAGGHEEVAEWDDGGFEEEGEVAG